MFLGYLAYPARKSSPRDKMPWFDWVFALIAGFCGASLFFFYRELATRPGIPTLMDVVVASAGLLLLLEVSRRALGAPMAGLGIVFVMYALLGPWHPAHLAHRGRQDKRRE